MRRVGTGVAGGIALLLLGYRDLWMLQAVLDDKEERQAQARAA